MVEEELALNVGCIDANLVHANLWLALHIALVAYPNTTPTLEVDVDRECCALLAVLEEVYLNLLAGCRCLVVNPYNESREVVVATALNLRFKLEVLLYVERCSRLISPLKRLVAVLEVGAAKFYSRLVGRDELQLCLLLEREHTRVVVHLSCCVLANREACHTNKSG